MRRGSVKAITVRNLPPAVARAVRERARQGKLSLNMAIVTLLEEATGAPPPARSAVHHDLDHLAGAWSEGQYREFLTSQKDHRRIDPEMWK